MKLCNIHTSTRSSGMQMNAVPLTKIIQNQLAQAEDPAPRPCAITIFLPSTKTGCCSSSVLGSCNILLCNET